MRSFRSHPPSRAAPGFFAGAFVATENPAPRPTRSSRRPRSSTTSRSRRATPKTSTAAACRSSIPSTSRS